MKIEPVLNGIDDPNLLSAVEQKILYAQKAAVWLDENASNWKELF